MKDISEKKSTVDEGEKAINFGLCDDKIRKLLKDLPDNVFTVKKVTRSTVEETKEFCLKTITIEYYEKF